MVLIALAGASVAVACGRSDDAGPTTTSTAVTTTVLTSTTTTTSPTTTTGTRERWLGATWEPQADDPTHPVVDGADVGLTSVAGLCQGADCAFGLDLLTSAAVTGAPPAGPYVLWSSRSTGTRPDGGPTWQIVDVADVVLDPGMATFLCSPVGDPSTTFLGIASTSTSSSDTVTPQLVWSVDADGAITTPDPSGFACEVGQD